MPAVGCYCMGGSDNRQCGRNRASKLVTLVLAVLFYLIPLCIFGHHSVYQGVSGTPSATQIQDESQNLVADLCGARFRPAGANTSSCPHFGQASLGKFTALPRLEAPRYGGQQCAGQELEVREVQAAKQVVGRFLWKVRQVVVGCQQMVQQHVVHLFCSNAAALAAASTPMGAAVPGGATAGDAEAETSSIPPASWGEGQGKQWWQGQSQRQKQGRGYGDRSSMGGPGSADTTGLAAAHPRSSRQRGGQQACQSNSRCGAASRHFFARFSAGDFDKSGRRRRQTSYQVAASSLSSARACQKAFASDSCGASYSSQGLDSIHPGDSGYPRERGCLACRKDESAPDPGATDDGTCTGSSKGDPTAQCRRCGRPRGGRARGGRAFGRRLRGDQSSLEATQDDAERVTGCDAYNGPECSRSQAAKLGGAHGKGRLARWLCFLAAPQLGCTSVTLCPVEWSPVDALTVKDQPPALAPGSWTPHEDWTSQLPLLHSSKREKRYKSPLMAQLLASIWHWGVLTEEQGVPFDPAAFFPSLFVYEWESRRQARYRKQLCDESFLAYVPHPSTDTRGGAGGLMGNLLSVEPPLRSLAGFELELCKKHGASDAVGFPDGHSCTACRLHCTKSNARPSCLRSAGRPPCRGLNRRKVSFDFAISFWFPAPNQLCLSDLVCSSPVGFVSGSSPNPISAGCPSGIASTHSDVQPCLSVALCSGVGIRSPLDPAPLGASLNRVINFADGSADVGRSIASSATPDCLTLVRLCSQGLPVDSDIFGTCRCPQLVKWACHTGQSQPVASAPLPVGCVGIDSERVVNAPVHEGPTGQLRGNADASVTANSACSSSRPPLASSSLEGAALRSATCDARLEPLLSAASLEANDLPHPFLQFLMRSMKCALLLAKLTGVNISSSVKLWLMQIYQALLWPASSLLSWSPCPLRRLYSPWTMASFLTEGLFLTCSHVAVAFAYWMSQLMRHCWRR